MPSEGKPAPGATGAAEEDDAPFRKIPPLLPAAKGLLRPTPNSLQARQRRRERGAEGQGTGRAGDC